MGVIAESSRKSTLRVLRSGTGFASEAVGSPTRKVALAKARKQKKAVARTSKFNVPYKFGQSAFDTTIIAALGVSGSE